MRADYNYVKNIKKNILEQKYCHRKIMASKHQWKGTNEKFSSQKTIFWRN